MIPFARCAPRRARHEALAAGAEPDPERTPAPDARRDEREGGAISNSLLGARGATKASPFLATLFGVLAFAAAGGLTEAVRSPLSARESLLAAALWLGLALPLAFCAALAAVALALLVGRRVASAVVLAGLTLLALAAPVDADPPARLAFGAIGAAAALATLGAPQGSRRVFALAIGALPVVAVLVGALRSATPAPPPRTTAAGTKAPRPDVVLVVLDTQRADYLGAYRAPGHEGASLTPVFDAFAADSTLYEQAYSAASWTVPSHGTLFTGLPPLRHGASFVHHRWLDDRFVTLAEVLRASGYRTVALVANHWLEITNLLQGFDEVHPLGRRFESLLLRRPLEVLGLPEQFMDHGASDAAPAAERALGKGTGDPRPLFLFVNLLEPHWRHLPPLEDRLATLPRGVGFVQATLLSLRYYGPLVMAGKQIEGPLDPTLRGLYAGAVRHQDRELGRLLDVLRSRLDLANALVVITADHGENLGDGGRYDHVFALNDALIHVPLVVHWPGGAHAGARVAGLAQLADVPVTIAEAAGATGLAPDPDTRSLAPDRFVPRATIVAESDPYYGHLEAMATYTGLERDIGRYARLLRAVRDEERKLVRRSDGTTALYDLRSDPDETVDVREREPERAATLAATLDAWVAARAPYTEEEGPGREAPAREIDPAERERLRALGYVR